MKILLAFLAFLALLTLSCAASVKATVDFRRPTPMLWKFDCKYPADRRNEVIEAFNYWDNRTDVVVFSRVQSCEIETDLTVRVVNDDFVQGGIPNVFIMGTGYPHMITFYRSWTNSPDYWLRENIERHEVGHVLGFDHTVDQDCLMFHTITTYYYDKAKPLCRAEREMFQALYGY